VALILARGGLRAPRPIQRLRLRPNVLNLLTRSRKYPSKKPRAAVPPLLKQLFSPVDPGLRIRRGILDHGR
jgi:hypothetical protein